MSCELTPSVLHGYIDGELDAARAAEFERHLLSCPQCVTALEAQEKLRAAIHRADLYERAPAALRRAVERESGAAAPTTAAPLPMKARAPAWRWQPVAAVLFLAGFLGWRLIPGLGGFHDQTEVASAVVDAHLRSLQPGHLEDVISTDQHTVKPWFDGKLDFAPPVRDFTTDGFPLQGGRLDFFRGRAVAVLVYGRRKHFINVFIWPTGEPDAGPRCGSQLGYNWVESRKAGMELWAVSDVSPAELNAFHQLLTQ